MIQKIIKTISLFATLAFFGVFPAMAQAATLSLNPASGSLNAGCEVTLRVELDTQGVQTDGTDVILTYNPSQLSISTSGITNGTIYPEYPGNSVDATGGRVSISGISSVSSPYTGTGTFATLKFTVASGLAAGTPVNVSFDFDPNNKTKTTDTNVVERGTIADVLSAVTNGTYAAGTGTCAGGTGVTSGSGTGTGAGTGFGQGQALTGSNNASGSAFPVYTPGLNEVTGGSAGLLDSTFGVAALGIILVVLGVAGLSML